MPNKGGEITVKLSHNWQDFFGGGGGSLFTIPLAHEHVCASQVDFKHEKDGIKEF